MFTHTLQLSERHALLSLAILLVHIDGDFAAEESTRLRALRREMALPLDTELPEDPITVLPAPFESHESRCRIMLELLLIAAADDLFHPQERAFIEDVAERMDIKAERLNGMIEWTRDHTRLMKAAAVLWR
jgi:tellurite resistance protein